MDRFDQTTWDAQRERQIHTRLEQAGMVPAQEPMPSALVYNGDDTSVRNMSLAPVVDIRVARGRRHRREFLACLPGGDVA